MTEGREADQTFRRLSGLESGHNRLERELLTLTTQVSSVASSVDRIEDHQNAQYERLMRTMEEQSRKISEFRERPTPWGIIASWIGVAVVIWSMSLAPLYRAATKNESALTQIMQTRWSREDHLAAATQANRRLEGIMSDIRGWQDRQDERILYLERDRMRRDSAER